MSLKINLETNFAEYVLDLGKIILGTQQMGQTNPQLWEKQNETILQAICALLNSGGGVIKAESENEDYDYEIHGLELNIPPSFSSCLDVLQQEKFLWIFVKSWNTEAGVRVATLCSNLYYRERASTTVVDPQEALAFLRGKAEAPVNINISHSLSPQGARCGVQYENNIKALAAALFDRVKLQYLEKLNFPKSTHVEFIMFSADVSQCVKDRLPKCISALANTEGGYVFFGVHDETRQVIGCETHQIAILSTTVDSCIKKLTVHHFCTQRPELQRSIKFLEVRDKGILRGYVCAIKVERFCCAVFAKDPSSWEVKDNCVKPLATKKWVAWMMEADPDLSRFPEMVLELSVSSATPHSRTVCCHKNLKRLQEQQKHYFPVLSDRVVYTPENLYKELFSQHQGLRELINAEMRSVSQGVLIFSRSWAVDLGLPENPGVICEALLISQNNTPIFYSIFSHWNMACKGYSMIVAQTLKQRLVNRGGYTGRLCITPLVFLLHPDRNTQPLYGSDLQIYPESYNLMTTEDVETLLRSLVIVLFGFRSFLSDELGSEVLNLLTDKQYELLSKDLHRTKELFVHGLPGSGKTVLALKIMEKIRNVFHCETDHILYICENQPLKKFISTKNSCQSVTRKTFMRKDFNHIQHIIIDEAQNFCTEDGDWYRKARTITQGAQNCRGILWIFLDYFQTNHLRCTGLPPLSDQYPREELTRVVRSADPIADCLQNIMQGIRENPPPNLLPESLVMLHDPEWAQGVPGNFEIVEFSSLDEMVTYVADKCRFFCRNGYSPRDIGVIFSRASEMNGCKDRLLAAMRRRRMSKLSEEPDVLLQIRDTSDIFGNHIVLDDVHRFSGLERNIVFGINPRAVDPNIFHSLLLCLVSRAKNHLYILNVSC
ncbi:schlafen family member 5 [Nycticebus coucang]|uniref:schlafen family member 5 n=1 Tax=Nycticebus coucang TaxID=9470 RepID=UPI00234C7ED6|nr:schlafen family member 5 [Nycticebus coucang]XP_053426059.1 schlafen family member 5 [Nycticebus coucang]